MEVTAKFPPQFKPDYVSNCCFNSNDYNSIFEITKKKYLDHTIVTLFFSPDALLVEYMNTYMNTMCMDRDICNIYMLVYTSLAWIHEFISRKEENSCVK